MTHAINYHIPIPMYVQIPVMVVFSVLYVREAIKERRKRD